MKTRNNGAKLEPHRRKGLRTFLCRQSILYCRIIKLLYGLNILGTSMHPPHMTHTWKGSSINDVIKQITITKLSPCKRSKGKGLKDPRKWSYRGRELSSLNMDGENSKYELIRNHTSLSTQCQSPTLNNHAEPNHYQLSLGLLILPICSTLQCNTNGGHIAQTENFRKYYW